MLESTGGQDLYGVLFRRLLFPLWEVGIRRRPTLELLAGLERSQWASLDELHARQSADLRRLVAHAHAHVPYYRRRMAEAGVGPEDLRDPEDLHRLPVVDAKALRDTQVERSSEVDPHPTIRKTTGGTTGSPLVFGYDPLSEYWRLALKLRGYGWAGLQPGDRSFHFWGSLPVRRSRAKRLKIAVDHVLRREQYVDCGSRDDALLGRVVEELRRRPPRAIVCYAQAGADLARHVNERRARSWETIPVICGAEALTPPDRAALEQAFGPAVFETYGCREVMLVGTECSAHAGLHVSMENLVVELVVRDEHGERPAAPGEVGEVVLTDLHNLGMPFLRYANGDLASWAPPGRCTCGRTLPRLARVEGRVTETLRDGLGRRVNGLLFNIVFTALPGGVRQWQAVQHKDGAVTVKLVPTAAFDADARARVMQACGMYLPGVQVVLESVSSIPPAPGGKRPLVRVER